MGASTEPTTSAFPLTKVLTRASLKAYGIPFSNPTLLRMERRGTFPRRFFLSAKCPAWNVKAIEAWIAEREASAMDSNGITAHATIAAMKPEVQAKRKEARAEKTRKRAEMRTSQ